MQSYIQDFRAYVQAHKLIFDQDCPQPCLDSLWWHYGEYHNLDNEVTREGFRAIRVHLDKLPVHDSDSLFTEISTLCAEYERLAFIAGLHLGAQLMQELKDA